MPPSGCQKRRARAAICWALACALPALCAACTARLRPWWTVAFGDGGGERRDVGADTPKDLGSTTCPNDPQPIGYAALSSDDVADDAGVNATTGGVGPDAVAPIIVDARDSDALTQVMNAAKMTAPVTIEINGIISFPALDADNSSQAIKVASNKTIVGGESASGFRGGGLTLTNVSNVIIRNLVIGHPVGPANVDAIHIETSHNVWVDHCDLSSEGPDASADSFDGLIDISRQSDFVTVSWTYFHDHKDTGIIGRSDEDTGDVGYLHVTYHHDWFDRVTAGPRLRFGNVHVFNVYFNDVSYFGVAATMSGNIRVENNVFTNVAPVSLPQASWPITTTLHDSVDPGEADVEPSNLLDSTDGPNNITKVSSWNPTYPYAAAVDSTSSVPTIVQACAGAGKIVPAVAP